MTDSYTLGKNGKFGKIDFNKLRSGITKEELGIQEGSILESIWNEIDTNQEGDSKGKLDRSELNRFIAIIKTLCGNDKNLSANEAENFELEDGEKLGKKHKEELLVFLSKLSELTKDVAKVETGFTTKIETITYEDGHTEKLKPDGSKTITSSDGKTITETYPNGNVKKEIIRTDDGKITITEKDSAGNTTKETISTKYEETVTEYESGSKNPKKQTTTNRNMQTIILYSKGQPIKKTTINQKNREVKEFDIVGDGAEVLTKKTTPLTGETVFYEKGKITRKIVSTKKDNETRVSDTVYDGDNSTESVSINGKERYQKKIIDGKKYEVSYDEKGNTTGVIVQNGETIKTIAEKFGVKPADLIKANAHLLKGGKKNFNVGDKIVIPRKMDADEYVNAQKGRKDAAGAKAESRAAIERRNAATETTPTTETKAKTETASASAPTPAPAPVAKTTTTTTSTTKKAEVKEESERIFKGANGYYVTKTKDGQIHYYNPQGNEISGDEFKKYCPSIYQTIIQAQRGATQRTHKKYDTNTIKKESSELAKKIHTQISGISSNEKTINLLRGINSNNAAFVVSEYQRMYKVSLAQDINAEFGLDLNTVKEHVCQRLVTQAKNLGIKGIYYGDYQKINDLNSLQAWIDKVSAKIIKTMTNATETYYATDAEETKRKQVTENAKIAKTSAEQIVNDLIGNSSGFNDINKLKAIIARIDKPEELNEVNRLLTLKGYPPTDKYSPIENFIYQESDHNVVHPYNSSDYLEQVVQGWIDNGTLKGQEANKAQARMAARVLYDGGDGFGTDCDKIKKAVRMIKCPKPTGNKEYDKKQAQEVYRLVNNMIKKHNTFYGLGSTCTDLLDYCKGEMWDSEVKYLKGILAETDAIKGEEKAQAVTDLTQEAVEGAGTDIEYLEQAIKGINSPADRKAVEAKLEAYCKKKNIKPQIEGQSYLQAILYDECDTFMGISRDHKEIRKFNEMMIAQGAYTTQEIVNLRAEQATLQILEGDFDNIKDAVEQIKDPKVLAKVNQLLATKGYESLDAFLNSKLNQTKSDLVNAELASNNLLANAKAADVAYRLIKNSDFNTRAQGIRAIRNEEVAKLVDEQLTREGSSLAEVLEKFNKEKAEYKSKATLWGGLGKFLPIVGTFAEDISDAYRENTDSSDNMFVEMKQPQNLNSKQKTAYALTVKLMEEKLAQMEKDYKAALDSQGVVSSAVNNFCEQYGIGTTKEEIETRIEHDKETVRLLKLASEGKLGKMVNGKTVAVTFEEVFKERNVGTDFNTTKVEKVANQAQMLVAMDYAKTNIAVCWEELENGLNYSDSKRLSVAIIDTLEKLSNMTGKKLSLAGYGYSVKEDIIVGSDGKPVSVDNLKMLANQLKQGLSDVANDLLGDEIPLNTSSSKINEVLEKSYNSKKESFKKEFKAAFGQDCPDEMVEDYISTVETGKSVVNMGTLIGAVIAAPFTGGGSLAVFAAGAGVSLGLNALEHSTDANGWTNAEWTSDAEQAMWDGALSALGVKIGVIADAKAMGVYKTAAQNMLKNLVPNISAKTLDRASVCIARVRAMGYEVTSDSIQSIAQTYCQQGEFDEESFVRALLISVVGNSVGHIVNGIGDIKAGKADVGDAPKAEGTSDHKAEGAKGRKAESTSEHINEHNGTENAYSSQSDNELFVEYQNLRNSILNSSLDKETKLAYIKQADEIKAELKSRGYEIQGDAFSSKQADSSSDKLFDKAFINSLEKKYGAKIANAYKEIKKNIKKLKTLADFEKIKNKIDEFINYQEFKALYTELLAQAKEISLEGITAKAFNKFGLSKYYSNAEIKAFAQDASIPDVNAMKSKGFELRQEKLNPRDNSKKIQTIFYNPKEKVAIIYSFDNGGRVQFKNIIHGEISPDGKIINITEAIDITFDSGNSTVTFRGFENSPKNYVNDQFTNKSNYNKAGAANNANFKTETMKRNQMYECPEDATIILAGSVSIKLNDPKVKNYIDRLPEGGRLTIGREGNIKVNDPTNKISRVHVIIEKRNGKIYVIDNSTNGTVLKTRSANKAQGTGNANSKTSSTRGQTNSTAFNSTSELETKISNMFSERTKNTIINAMNKNGYYCCQKNGIEYRFTRENGQYVMKEFDINKKYKVQRYDVEEDSMSMTTFNVETKDDIYWALCNKIQVFSDRTQSRIITDLKNGQTVRLSKNHIYYEFTIDNEGNITVTEFANVKESKQKASGESVKDKQKADYEQQKADYNQQMKETEKKERIATLKKIIERSNDIDNFRTRFTDILDDDFQVKSEADLESLKRVAKQMRGYNHSDIGEPLPDKISTLIEALHSKLRSKEPPKFEEINKLLDELRAITDVDNVKAELKELESGA